MLKINGRQISDMTTRELRAELSRYNSMANDSIAPESAKFYVLAAAEVQAELAKRQDYWPE